MNVRVRLFAAAKQVVGNENVDVVLDAGATVADLRAALGSQFPDLQRLAQHAMFAVGTNYAEPEQVLSDEADVAMIPPVSGG